MLTGCNCFQIWQRVLCVGMKGLVSAHFLCKLAWSIHSSPPRGPGLCHSAARFSPPARCSSAAFSVGPSLPWLLRGCRASRCAGVAPPAPVQEPRALQRVLCGQGGIVFSTRARALRGRGTGAAVESGLQNEPSPLWPGASAARIIFAVAFLTDFKQITVGHAPRCAGLAFRRPPSPGCCFIGVLFSEQAGDVRLRKRFSASARAPSGAARAARP